MSMFLSRRVASAGLVRRMPLPLRAHAAVITAGGHLARAVPYSTRALPSKQASRWPSAKQLPLVVAGVATVYGYMHRETEVQRKLSRLCKEALVKARQGDFDGAAQLTVEVYAVAKESDPHDPRLSLLSHTIAKIYLEMKKPNVALEYLQKTIDARINFPDPAIRDWIHVTELTNFASIYYARNEARAAENYFRQGMDVYAKSPAATPRRVGDRIDSSVLLHLSALKLLDRYCEYLMAEKRWDDAQAIVDQASTQVVINLPRSITYRSDKVNARIDAGRRGQTLATHNEHQ